MEKYKQRKQANNLLHVFLLTLFTSTSLFSVTGVVYSLITVGIGSPLFLLCSISFATCTTLSAYNAYAIHNNITHRRSGKAPKKETACSTNEKLIILEDNSKDLIDFSDLPISNEKYDAPQYISNDILKTSKETLIPEVVKSTNPDNKSKLKLLNSSNNQVTTTNDKCASQNLKSPSQIRGSNFAGPTRGIAIQQSNNPLILHQPQKNSTLSMLEISMVNKSKTLSQSQNISNLNKSTAPISPPMPTAIYDSSKILSQPQDTINQSISITPTHTVDLNDKPNIVPQATEQNNSNRQDDIEHHKEEIDQQPNSVASQLPLPPPPMPKFLADEPKIINQLQHIKDISQTKLKCIDESEKNKYSKSDRDKLLEDIRKDTKLRHVTENEINQYIKNVQNSGIIKKLQKRVEMCQYSDDESDHSTPSPDWEEEVKVPSEIQEQSSNKSTEDYVEGSNHHIDSGISDGESSPEKINTNISKDRQPKISLPHSYSNNCIERSVEQPNSSLSHLSSYPSTDIINMS